MRSHPEAVQPPSIRIHVHEAVTDEALAELLLGVEEEGVPVVVDRMDELNPLVLAHAAALQSRLGLGLGVALDYAVVTLEKLPAERPYLVERWGHDPQRDRVTGSNAARIVKRIPLRPSTERNS